MTDDPHQELEHLNRISTLLDSKYRLPGTQMRFGWDTILGLVPGVGDAAALVPACYLLYKGHRLGARKRTISRMAINTGLDATIGAIPVLGDVFDLFFKANNRNVELLKRELEIRRVAQA